jgi:hypothetical protein
MKKGNLGISRLSAVMIYGYLAVFAYMFLQVKNLPVPQKVQYLGVYIPAMIASLYFFVAGINWAAGMYTENAIVLVYSVLQYAYLFYFEFIMKFTGEETFGKMGYYKRAIYYVPIILIQLFVDRKLMKAGTLPRWFFIQKSIANIILIAACIWNYKAFGIYFKPVE